MHAPHSQIDAEVTGSNTSLSLAMTLTASQFQNAMAILKLWWQDALEQRKVNGKCALCDGNRSCDVAAYISKYVAKHEIQMRGTLHVHYLAWNASPSGPYAEYSE